MKKILCLCLTCLFAYISTAQARVEFIAKEGGITFKSPKSVNCGDNMENYGGKCVPLCDKTVYPFAGTPTEQDKFKGRTVLCATKNRWGYSGCYVDNGYESSKDGKNCVPIDCSGFPLNADEVNNKIGEYQSCKTAGTTKYKYTKCIARGYKEKPVNGRCIPNECDKTIYPFNSIPIEEKKKIGKISEICYEGDEPWWGFVECYGEDKELYQGACWNKCTGYNSPTDVIDGCLRTSDCLKRTNGTDLKSFYKCVECNTNKGYEKEPNTEGMCNLKKINCVKGEGKTQDKCAVGDIYYADDTCSSDILCGKTPIGIVGDTEHKLVIELEQAVVHWANKEKIEVPGVPGRNESGKDFNGKKNTDTIIAYGKENKVGFPAAEYCNNKTTGKKSWYLPAVGELFSMLRENDNMAKFHATQDRLYAAGFTKYSFPFANVGETVYTANGQEKCIEWKGDDGPNQNAQKDGIWTSNQSTPLNGDMFAMVVYENYDCSKTGTGTRETTSAERFVGMHHKTGVNLEALTKCVFSYKEEDDECQTGYIYYDDDTCSNDLIKGKNAIGVVLSSAPDEKWVVGLEEKELSWCNGGRKCKSNIKELTDFAVNECPAEEYDGKRNTDVVMSYGKKNDLNHEAAKYCTNYNVGGKSWYLPSLGQIHRLRDTAAPKEKLEILGKKLQCYRGSDKTDVIYYWSSTEMSPYKIDDDEDPDQAQAWVLEMCDNSYCFSEAKTQKHLTRCMFTYKSGKNIGGDNGGDDGDDQKEEKEDDNKGGGDEDLSEYDFLPHYGLGDICPDDEVKWTESNAMLGKCPSKKCNYGAQYMTFDNDYDYASGKVSACIEPLDVLYEDGTTGSGTNIDKSKKVIGIVYDKTNHWAVSIKDDGKNETIAKAIETCKKKKDGGLSWDIPTYTQMYNLCHLDMETHGEKEINNLRNGYNSAIQGQLCANFVMAQSMLSQISGAKAFTTSAKDSIYKYYPGYSETSGKFITFQLKNMIFSWSTYENTNIQTTFTRCFTNYAEKANKKLPQQECLCKTTQYPNCGTASLADYEFGGYPGNVFPHPNDHSSGVFSVEKKDECGQTCTVCKKTRAYLYLQIRGKECAKEGNLWYRKIPAKMITIKRYEIEKEKNEDIDLGEGFTGISHEGYSTKAECEKELAATHAKVGEPYFYEWTPTYY